MPAEEFLLHQAFFNRYKWGVESDMLSLIFSQVLSSRVGKQIKTENHEWKDLAFYKSGKDTKRVDNTQAMRDAFMVMAKTIGKEKPNG